MMDYESTPQRGTEAYFQMLKEKQKRWKSLQSKRFAIQKRFGFENTQKAELPPGLLGCGILGFRTSFLYVYFLLICVNLIAICFRTCEKSYS